jgi:hypothetical protein
MENDLKFGSSERPRSLTKTCNWSGPRKVANLLVRYSHENGYAIIFDSSVPDSPIVYKSTNLEVTPEIIRLYDKAFPADIR